MANVITLTGLSLAPNAAPGKFNASFNVKASAASTASFLYYWRVLGTEDWNYATTTLPDSKALTTSNAVVSGVFDLGASDNFTGNTTEDVEFYVDAVIAGTAATGTLTFSDATNYGNGDYFTVAGDKYEFTTDGDFTAGSIPVLITGTETNAQVAAAAAEAINTFLAAKVTATVAAAVVTVTEKTVGAAGNVAIAASSNKTTVVGLAGGADTVSAYESIAYANASANAIGEATTISHSAANTSTFTSGKIVESFTLNQFGARPADHITQGWARKSIAYKMIDLLRKGEEDKFDIVPDHFGLDLRRAVLISVNEWNRVRGTNSFSIELKAKQWFAYYANKGLSRESFFDNGQKVYAIFESKITNGRSSQVVLAYLVSDATYRELASAAAA